MVDLTKHPGPFKEKRYTFALKNKRKKKKKNTSKLPHFRDNKFEKFIFLEIFQVLLLNSRPQLLLGESIVCFWTTVQMPIVHFSVLLVFKKFATHNTEQFQIQCAVTQPSKPLPTKVGRAPLRNFTGKGIHFLVS